MKILIVCATTGEAIDPGIHPQHDVDVLVTGPGMVATAFLLGRQLLNSTYDLAINIGICGAFKSELVGKVVNVKSDCFADFGAEDGDDFLDIFQTGLIRKDEEPFKNGWLHADYEFQSEILKGIQEVKGITINKTSGNDATIRKLRSIYNADVESMEGAAFFYTCLLSKTPCLQVRAVSNLIERRNRSAWKIDDALKELHSSTETFLHSLL